jgi:hypothetical protein
MIKKNIDKDDVNDDEDENLEDSEETDEFYKSKNIIFRKRTKAKIRRYRRYMLENDQDNFYREQLMLYTPWVSEDKDILKTNFEEEFKKNEDLIKENRQKFNKVWLEQGEIDAAVNLAEENPSVNEK